LPSSSRFRPTNPDPSFATRRSFYPELAHLAAAGAAIAAVTIAYGRWLHVTNATTVALTFLLIVLVVSAVSRLWVAVAASIAAMLAFNFFFLPPVGTFTIADPQNWIALFAFLAVALVASNLSSVARARADEATARRDEVAKLFDLSRDILLMTDSDEAVALLARFIARRFDLNYVAICLPRAAGWQIAEGGPLSLELNQAQLDLTLAGASRTLEFDAQRRTYAGHRTLQIGDHTVELVPLRLGSKPVGLLASAGHAVDPGALDALGGVAAIAIERLQFLQERKSAEMARQSEELKSALLASLGHDLRTPLTAIRVAATNLRGSWPDERARGEQTEVILTEVERLTRLFQNILEMARIDAGAVPTERQWTHPSQIIEAARAQVEHTLGTRALNLSMPDAQTLVRLDPQVTAAAVAHLLENAAQYSPADAPIELEATITDEGLRITVRDRGPGIAAADLPRLFDRFYRGVAAQGRVSGTGMGLAIARGLLAAEDGRVWAENCPDGGARFTVLVPGEHKAMIEAT
jgi:two-component system, OmpR family, sensor histidine kinase KdpD